MSAGLKTSRNFLDVFADRVRQASVEPTLIAFGQKLCNLLDVETSQLRQPAVLDFLHTGQQPEAAALLRWVRENHTLYAVLCASKFPDADAAMEDMEVAAEASGEDHALPRRAYHIPIRATCLSPLSHGADGKSGNATLFRRMDVLGANGTLLSLPYYAGNAIRGQVRDILADHFTEAMGLKPDRARPPWELWFFHALYSGGALEEASASTKALAKELGDNGAVRSDGVRRFRDGLPALSLLGMAAGNRVLSGHADFGDWRPICKDWGNGGTVDAAALTEWLYLTRRDDHEGRTDEDGHAGMIAVTECLKAGTMLEGGIDLRQHVSDLSRSALGLALRELAARGRIGAQNRADLGMVEITAENAPDPEPYESYLRENRAGILDYLEKIGAIHARDSFNL